MEDLLQAVESLTTSLIMAPVGILGDHFVDQILSPLSSFSDDLTLVNLVEEVDVVLLEIGGSDKSYISGTSVSLGGKLCRTGPVTAFNELSRTDSNSCSMLRYIEEKEEFLETRVLILIKYGSVMVPENTWHTVGIT